jgi:hypothetical protein
MSLGLHNVSSETSIRLASRQVSELRPEWDGVRRRFWAKVRCAETAHCWLWQGSRTSNGRYGQFSWTERYGRTQPIGAHRAAYELTHGVELEKGQQVLHSCDRPLCVNPFHLWVGTHTANMQDASAKGRLHAPRPSRQKVTDAQCEEVIALVRSGMTLQTVADRFGVSRMTISHICSGKRRQYRQRPALERTA